VAENESESLLNEIGRLVMEDGEHPSEPTLLYAELDRNLIGQSIFKELNDQLLYRRPLNEPPGLCAS
jgi:hypothetical protein